MRVTLGGAVWVQDFLYEFRREYILVFFLVLVGDLGLWEILVGVQVLSP